jgi:hypothetical protein
MVNAQLLHEQVRQAWLDSPECQERIVLCEALFRLFTSYEQMVDPSTGLMTSFMDNYIPDIHEYCDINLPLIQYPFADPEDFVGLDPDLANILNMFAHEF